MKGHATGLGEVSRGISLEVNNNPIQNKVSNGILHIDCIADKMTNLSQNCVKILFNFIQVRRSISPESGNDPVGQQIL